MEDFPITQTVSDFMVKGLSWDLPENRITEGPKGLLAPASFWTLSPEEKKRICNHIGPDVSYLCCPIRILAKGFFFFLNWVWGVKVSDAGDIHDYMYFIGISESDRAKADRHFQQNLDILCLNARRRIPFLSWWILWLRRLRCMSYFHFVSTMGKGAFMRGKGRVELKNIK